MKIRNGFVSNSSSSSFCILGYYMDLDNFVSKLKLSEAEIKELEDLANFDEEAKIEYDKEENKIVLLANLIRDKFGFDELFYKLGINGVYDSESEFVVVGQSWPNIRDDETGGEFRMRVKQECGFYLDDVGAPQTHEGEIYN